MNRPTMEDVALRAGVSRALVSLVMNDSPKVSEEKRQAVEMAAVDLGYRPNLHARNLAQQRTQTIGVLVNDLHNPFFSEVIDGIEAEADRRNMQVLILNGGHHGAREERGIETYLQFQVEGMVLVGTRLDDQQLLAAAENVPLVTVAAGWEHPGVDIVTTDEVAGAALAVEHLVSLGHEAIVHFDGAQNISAAPRRQGYVDAMRRLGLEPRIILTGDSEAAARPACDHLLEISEETTAIFAFNDLLAAGVLDCLNDHQIAVPDHMSLIGYDNTFIAALGHLSITTINQPRVEMGRLAIETVLERIEDGRTEPVRRVLQPELIERDTAAAPPIKTAIASREDTAL